MAFRDSLTAAQARMEALEQQITELGSRAAEAARLERENRTLRAELARARSDYMPTAARSLSIGIAGCGALAIYLLIKLSLSLVGAHIHLPLVSVAGFVALIIGMFALCKLGFGTVAPATLLVGVFFFNQLATMGHSVEMLAITHSSWVCLIALGAYIVLRAPHVPRGISVASASLLTLAGLSYVGVLFGWDQISNPGDFSLAMIADGVLVLHLLAAASVGACFYAARKHLLETAPTPPETAPPPRPIPNA
jgi:hypothetical protein